MPITQILQMYASQEILLGSSTKGGSDGDSSGSESGRGFGEGADAAAAGSGAGGGASNGKRTPAQLLLGEILVTDADKWDGMLTGLSVPGRGMTGGVSKEGLLGAIQVGGAERWMGGWVGAWARLMGWVGMYPAVRLLAGWRGAEGIGVSLLVRRAGEVQGRAGGIDGPRVLVRAAPSVRTAPGRLRKLSCFFYVARQRRSGFLESAHGAGSLCCCSFRDIITLRSTAAAALRTSRAPFHMAAGGTCCCCASRRTRTPPLSPRLLRVRTHGWHSFWTRNNSSHWPVAGAHRSYIYAD